MKKVLSFAAIVVMIVGFGCDQSSQIVTDMELGRDMLNGSGNLNAAVGHLEKAKEVEENPTEARTLLVIAYYYGLSTGDARALGEESTYKSKGKDLVSSLSKTEIQAILDRLLEHRRYHKAAMDVIVASGQKGVSVLLGAVSSPLYAKIQSEVEEMLIRIGMQDASSIVEALSSSSMSKARKMEIVRVIAKIKNSDAKEQLVDFRSNVNGALKVEVEATLYQLGTTEYRSELIAGLSATDVETRRVATRAMSMINMSPTDKIIKAARDQDVQVRLHAMNALAKYPAKPALAPILEAVFGDPDTGVKQAATAAAIEHISKGYGKGLAKQLVGKIKDLENPDDRLRVVKLMRTDRIRNQIKINKFENLEYQIYEYMDKEENNEMVKRELNHLLNDLETSS